MPTGDQRKVLGRRAKAALRRELDAAKESYRYRLKELQAVMQTRLDNSITNMQDIRVAVKDSEGQIQNLVIRVSVLEEKINKGGKNALTSR